MSKNLSRRGFLAGAIAALGAVPVLGKLLGEERASGRADASLPSKFACVYWNPRTGDDRNDGRSAASAVQSGQRAFSLVADKGEVRMIGEHPHSHLVGPPSTGPRDFSPVAYFSGR